MRGYDEDGPVERAVEAVPERLSLGMRRLGTAPGTELREIVEREVKDARANAEEAANAGPDAMPEVARELTMLRGALSSVNRRAAELVVKIQPVLGREPRELVEREQPTAKAMADMPSTDIAKVIREMLEELHALETFLGSATQSVRL